MSSIKRNLHREFVLGHHPSEEHPRRAPVGQGPALAGPRGLEGRKKLNNAIFLLNFILMKLIAFTTNSTLLFSTLLVLF